MGALPPSNDECGRHCSPTRSPSSRHLRRLAMAGREYHAPAQSRPASGLNFVAISHRWLENPEWEAYRRPYPADHLGMKVTAVSKKSLYLLASICRTMGFQYFWLDCICIDQGSALEKAREVVNMGSYYAKSARTLIFPYGIDKVGPPLMSDGSLPVWHSRAWTVQEEALSGLIVKGDPPSPTMTGEDAKVLYAVYMGDCPNSDLPGMQSSIYLTARGTSSTEQYLRDFTNNAHPPADKDGKRRHLHLVARKDLTSYMMRAFEHLPPDNDIRDRAMRHIQILASRREWNVWSVLREMYRRGAHNSEDLVYSALTLLGVTVSPSAIKYGIGLRGALSVVAEAMHVDQRLLLTVVEAYRDNTWMDGYCVLPSFVDHGNTSFAPMLKHLRVLGTAEFLGHQGMLITAPSMQASLSFDIENQLTHEPRCVQVDALEDSSGLYVGTLSQTTAAGKHRDGHTLFKIAPHASLLGLELIAVTQIEPPGADDHFWTTERTSSVSTPLTTFFCLVCQDAGTAKHKVGVAVVRSAQFTWTIKRHTIA